MFVFRKNLYFQSESVAKQSEVWKELCAKWAEECDGRTKDELVSEGHVIMDEWCEDVPSVHNPWRTFDELPVDSPWRTFDQLPVHNPWRTFDQLPVHNPWRTFNELPVDNPFLLVKIKKYVYRAAYYNKVKDTITTTKESISRKEASAKGFKWKYIEDDEITHK